MTTTENPTVVLADKLDTIVAHLRQHADFPRIIGFSIYCDYLGILISARNDADEAPGLVRAAITLSDTSWYATRIVDGAKWLTEARGTIGDLKVRVSAILPGDAATSAAVLCNYLSGETAIAQAVSS